jgi:hypothetical protein
VARIEPDQPPSLLRPPRPAGVSLRFWQLQQPHEATLAPLHQIDAVLPAVVSPRVLARPRSAVPPPDGFLNTVIEMATWLRPEANPVQSAFRRCWTCTEDVHRAYLSTFNARVRSLSIGDLHPSVLWITRQHHRWQDTPQNG